MVDDEDALPPGGWTFPDDDPPWDAWRPEEAAERLAGFDVRWAIAAGWALDLFRGQETREHEDLEVTVPASQFDRLRDGFPGHDWHVVGAGQVWSIDNAAAFATMHQTWLRDIAAGLFRLDVFREPHDGDTWIFRRDRRLTRPYADVIEMSPLGVPIVAPEIVLLFKARWQRPKDEADLAGVLPLLDDRRRAWLAGALDLVHPGHPWRGRL